MFYHNINPILIQIGAVEIRYYGLVYFLGFLFFYFFLRNQVKKDKIKNLNESSLDTFMIYFIIGSIIGARLFEFLFYLPKVFFANPLEFFMIWNGGMSIHGGIAGGMLSAYIFSKKHKVSFYKLADLSAIPLLLFMTLGRIANFINGELWGTITNNANICIDYTKSQFVINPPEGCRHPYQLYEATKNFIAGLGLILINKYYKLKEGLLFWWSIFIYNTLRFLLDFYREESRILGISTGQALCIIFSLLSLYFIVKLSRTK